MAEPEGARGGEIARLLAAGEIFTEATADMLAACYGGEEFAMIFR